MEDFAESVRNESGAALPKDGTVAEGTSNVLVFLEQLAEYADTAGAVLRRNTDMDQTAENGHRTVLGVYVSELRTSFHLEAKEDGQSDENRCIFSQRRYSHS